MILIWMSHFVCVYQHSTFWSTQCIGGASCRRSTSPTSADRRGDPETGGAGRRHLQGSPPLPSGCHQPPVPRQTFQGFYKACGFSEGSCSIKLYCLISYSLIKLYYPVFRFIPFPHRCTQRSLFVMCFRCRITLRWSRSLWTCQQFSLTSTAISMGRSKSSSKTWISSGRMPSNTTQTGTPQVHTVSSKKHTHHPHRSICSIKTQHNR